MGIKVGLEQLTLAVTTASGMSHDSPALFNRSTICCAGHSQPQDVTKQINWTEKQYQVLRSLRMRQAQAQREEHHTMEHQEERDRERGTA